MSAGKRTWKDYLLSSGLPLEHSVLEKLEGLGIHYPREFHYDRPDEHGLQTTFSVDLRAGCRLVADQAELNLMVECKYRHDSVNWVFMPDAGDDFDLQHRETFSALSLLSDFWLAESALRDVLTPYPCCGKGVELLTDDASSRSIDQAISQLRYALPNLIAELLNGQINPVFADAAIQAHIVVPIVVTTAHLWRVREGVTIVDTRQAADISDVAETVSAVQHRRPPDNHLRRYSTRVLDEALAPDTKKKLDSAFTYGVPPAGYAAFRDWFAQFIPSAFFVVSHDAFSDLIAALLALGEKPNLLTPKSGNWKPAMVTI